MKRMSRMEGEKPTLMIIPMIDIIFFLLVFFMISTIYTIPQQSLSIMLPKTKTQQSAELRPVLIDFEKSGQLMIDDGYVTKEQLISPAGPGGGAGQSPRYPGVGPHLPPRGGQPPGSDPVRLLHPAGRGVCD